MKDKECAEKLICFENSWFIKFSENLADILNRLKCFQPLRKNFNFYMNPRKDKKFTKQKKIYSRWFIKLSKT